MGDSHLIVYAISNNRISWNHSCNQPILHRLLQMTNSSIKPRHQDASSTLHHQFSWHSYIVCSGKPQLSNRMKVGWTDIAKHNTKQMRHFLTLGWTSAEWDQHKSHSFHNYFLFKSNVSMDFFSQFAYSSAFCPQVVGRQERYLWVWYPS